MKIAYLECEDCIKANLRASKFPKDQSNPPTRPSEILHIDGKGPISPAARGGYRYFLNVVDGFTRKRWTLLAKKRSEYVSLFITLTGQIQTQTGRKIAFVRSDNEFRTLAFSNWARMNGAAGIKLNQKAP